MFAIPPYFYLLTYAPLYYHYTTSFYRRYIWWKINYFLGKNHIKCLQYFIQSYNIQNSGEFLQHTLLHLFIFLVSLSRWHINIASIPLYYNAYCAVFPVNLFSSMLLITRSLWNKCLTLLHCANHSVNGHAYAYAYRGVVVYHFDKWFFITIFPHSRCSRRNFSYFYRVFVNSMPYFDGVYTTLDIFNM